MPPSLWALLVSIKDYKKGHLEQVPGAHVDAENVSDYLQSTLGVPADHIKWLSDKTASRRSIITTFQDHLIGNPNIKAGDALLFYYSGHGAYLPAPKGWIVDEKRTGEQDRDDGMIEVILPWDEGVTNDGDSCPACAIPDRTLAALIHGAASLHGNNITIVLDCCSSGHGTRAQDAIILDGERLFPRVAPSNLLAPLQGDTDHHIISRPNSPFGENAPFQQGSLPQLHSEPETITADDSGSVNESDSPDPESSELADYTHILDQQIVAEHRRRASELAGIRRRGRFRALAASHVLLAACKPREKAMGGRDGGILTKLWLHFMKYGNVRPYTYAQLVKHINEGIEGINKSLKRAGSALLLDQHPQCEGIVRDRLIFEETMIKADQFKVKKLHGSEENLEIEAGSVHGVAESSVFDIYGLDASLKGTKLGTAKATVVRPLTSTAYAQLSLPPENFVLYTATVVLEPKLDYTLEGGGLIQAQAEQRLRSVLGGIPSLKEDEDAPQLRVCLKPDGHAELHRLDPLLSPLPNPIPLLTEEEIEGENIDRIFRGIAKFNLLLPLTNVTHPFSNEVVFKMHPITHVDATTGVCDVSEEPIKTIDDDIEVIQDSEYAIVLHNKSDTDLFVQVWYFDPDSYSIECLYEPLNDAQPTLPRRGTLQLGASRELSWPLTYYVPSPGTRSTLFAKVYLTERPVRLGSLRQDALIGPEANHDRHGEQEVTDTQGRWDTILQRITVREIPDVAND